MDPGAVRAVRPVAHDHARIAHLGKRLDPHRVQLQVVDLAVEQDRGHVVLVRIVEPPAPGEVDLDVHNVGDVGRTGVGQHIGAGEHVQLLRVEHQIHVTVRIEHAVARGHDHARVDQGPRAELTAVAEQGHDPLPATEQGRLTAEDGAGPVDDGRRARSVEIGHLAADRRGREKRAEIHREQKVFSDSHDQRVTLSRAPGNKSSIPARW
jgi:hypothetical protein